MWTQCCVQTRPPLTDLLRNMELTSSCVTGGFLELAAMRSGRRKQVTKQDSWRLYSSSHSTMENTIEFLLRMLSAWGDRMYSSTICFHRLRHNQPRKKLCTCSWKGCGVWNDKNCKSAYIIITIIVIKRISTLPIYHTRWEHRKLYNKTHTHTHTHTCMHTLTHQTRGLARLWKTL